MTILVTLLVYFALLMAVSRLTSRRADNDAFYRGNRRSPWYMVAFGMVGASISGVTFVSVPGMVMHTGMTYMQTCLGFILGYFAVAFLLLPVYYRLNLTTIYSFLQQRLGSEAHRTGASFFLLSKMTGAAVRFYVVCLILHRFVVEPVVLGRCDTATDSTLGTTGALGAAGALGGAGAFGAAGTLGGMASFGLTVAVMVVLIWLYTRRGGIKTLVWTDTLQTACMFTALILIIYKVVGMLDMSMGEALTAVFQDEHSRMFVFDDWVSKQNFWKQFVSGIFIVIVMTGLDQDMMQKNLTCKTLRDAQKDMCTYGFAFVPANLLFMILGVLLVMLASKQGIGLPANSDELLPMFAASGRLGQAVVVFFTVGIVAASFSSADSALTAMTTTWCVDIAGRPNDERLRRRVHVMMALVFAVIILMVRTLNSTSVIDAIYILCSYTYGPLLGLFAYSLTLNPSPKGEGSRYLRGRTASRHLTPLSLRRGVGGEAFGGEASVCILSPLLCYALNLLVSKTTGYQFGYELLMLNGLLTFVGLWAVKRK